MITLNLNNRLQVVCVPHQMNPSSISRFTRFDVTGVTEPACRELQLPPILGIYRHRMAIASAYAVGVL